MDDLMPHFEHDWEREVWETEREGMLERVRAARQSSVADAAIDVQKLFAEVKPTLVQDAPRACGSRPYPDPPGPDGECCDRLAHYSLGRQGRLEVVRRCPALGKTEVRALIAIEEERLEGELAKLRKFGPIGFENFDEMHGKGAGEAWRAARAFSQGKPPTDNVFLVGTTGLGKTRLILASHFTLLRVGVRSVYLTSPEMRQAFEDARSFDEEVRAQGQRLIERVRRAEALHIDDIGNIDDDDRKRGTFAEGLKSLLDRSRAAIFSATNLTWAEAKAHPDVGTKVMSRLISGGTVVRLAGTDWRIDHAKKGR